MTGALRKGAGGKEHAYHTLRCLSECWALGCMEVVMTSQCGLLRNSQPVSVCLFWPDSSWCGCGIPSATHPELFGQLPGSSPTHEKDSGLTKLVGTPGSPVPLFYTETFSEVVWLQPHCTAMLCLHISPEPHTRFTAGTCNTPSHKSHGGFNQSYFGCKW